MRKLKKEYKYMVSTRCRSSYFSDLHSAEDFAKSIQSDDVAIWVLSNDYYIVGLYGRDFDETYEEDEPVLNDKELLEKCKTNQSITDDDIGEYTDSEAILRKTKRNLHICTQEDLYKLKVLQKCKEHDLLAIQTHRKLGHDDNSNDIYRILRERIRWYDKYMYAIETGNTSGVNIELVTPVGIMEEEEPKPKKPVESNKKEVEPYDSLLDDEKAERINKCLNKL